MSALHFFFNAPRRPRGAKGMTQAKPRHWLGRKPRTPENKARGRPSRRFTLRTGATKRRASRRAGVSRVILDPSGGIGHKF
jgi:hypothetical protein